MILQVLGRNQFSLYKRLGGKEVLIEIVRLFHFDADHCTAPGEWTVKNMWISTELTAARLLQSAIQIFSVLCALLWSLHDKKSWTGWI